jgi:hypothetical protein
MRQGGVIGLILIALSVVALAVANFAFFTTERVGEIGFLSIDDSRPHTFVLNPVVGMIALVAGIVLCVHGLNARKA